jgi:hypothetical protein
MKIPMRMLITDYPVVIGQELDLEWVYWGACEGQSNMLVI